MHLLYLCWFGEDMGRRCFLLTFRLNCMVLFLISGSWSDSARFSWGFSRRGHTQAASGKAKFQWFFRGLVQHRKMRVPPKPRGLRSRRWGQAQLMAARGHPKVPESLVGIHLTSLSGDCSGSAIIHTWGCIMLYIYIGWLPCDDIVKYAHFRDQHSMAQSCSIYMYIHLAGKSFKRVSHHQTRLFDPDPGNIDSLPVHLMHLAYPNFHTPAPISIQQ